MVIDIIPITQEYIVGHLNDFFRLEHNWTELEEDAWTKENYLLDLPGKWRLSYAAEVDNLLVGYIIGSAAKDCPTSSNINKIVVDTLYRRKKIGKRLLAKYIQACLRDGIIISELKALPDNLSANMLYLNIGYKLTGTSWGKDDRMRYIYEKKLLE